MHATPGQHDRPSHAVSLPRMRLTGRTAQALETGRTRLMIAGVVFALAFAAVGMRLVDVTMLHGSGNQSLASAVALDDSPAARADIVDRNGRLLATSLPTASLYADPARMLDPLEATEQLMQVLPELNREKVLADLQSDRRFVWLRRNLTPRQQDAVNRMGIPGLYFEREEARFYPFGPLTSHLIGFTDIDGNGLAGVEQAFNRQLRHSDRPLQLSIDVRLQEVVHEELQAAIDEFQAVGGAGLILDANTGEVLAMVSLPDFNPYMPGDVPEETRFNRNTLGVYEMGSTFKIFNTAMALDAGVTTMTGGYDATDPIRVAGFTISDFHPQRRWLSVPEIFMHSSNIGSVHMALAVGTERQRAFMARLGLLTPSPIELPEVGAPMVPSPWREINTMTIAFGHGMAVSPIQLASSVAAVVNGGTMYPATLQRRSPGEAIDGTSVVDAATSERMRRLLRLVVENGTGRNANAEGYLVGGKTGTAEKLRGGQYDRGALLSSFIAAFPMTRPEYVVFAMLDEPHGNERTYGYATGGWVAAPVVRRVIERMGPMIGIAPVDEEAPEIRQALHIALPARDGRQLAAFGN